jgi:hypothetical protein
METKRIPKRITSRGNQRSSQGVDSIEELIRRYSPLALILAERGTTEQRFRASSE